MSLADDIGNLLQLAAEMRRTAPLDKACRERVVEDSRRIERVCAAAERAERRRP